MGLGVTVDRFDSRRLVGNCGKRISNLGESFLVWGGGNIDIIDGRRFFSSKQGFRFFITDFSKNRFVRFGRILIGKDGKLVRKSERDLFENTEQRKGLNVTSVIHLIS